MKVLIVGGGIGGLTLASFFRRLGITFEVVERMSQWGSQGFSIGMWDNGRDILEKLDLADRFDAEGERIRDFYLLTGRGKTIIQFCLDDFTARYGSAYTHLNRKKIHDWLLEKAGGSMAVKMGTTVQSLVQYPDHVEVVFSDASRGSYDFVVGADGIGSATREILFPGQPLRHYTHWRAWYAWVDNRFKRDRCLIEYTEPGRIISIFDDKEKAFCIFMARLPDRTIDTPEDRIARLKNVFKDCSAVVPALLEELRPEDITPTDMSVSEVDKWYSGRVILLGDAVHALEPFAGLGASMAMEDAYVLSGELFKLKEGLVSMSHALTHYETSRKKRVMRAREATAGMRFWATLRSRTLRTLASLSVPLTSRLAPHFPVNYFTRAFHALLQEEI